jgi:hypothetical protein
MILRRRRVAGCVPNSRVMLAVLIGHPAGVTRARNDGQAGDRNAHYAAFGGSSDNCLWEARRVSEDRIG